MSPPCLSLLSLSEGVEWQKQGSWIDGWLPGTLSLLTPSSHTLTVRGSEGGRCEGRVKEERWSGCNSRVQVSLCGHCGRRDGREKVGIVGTVRG